MARVYDTAAMQLLGHKNTPDYEDPANPYPRDGARGGAPDHPGRDGYILNPTMPAGVPDHYLKVVRGKLEEMTRAEKDVVDADLADKKKNSQVTDFERFPLMFDVAFDHENRIRAREGKGPIDKAQFRINLKALL